MDAQGLTSSQRKLVMWYKAKELKSKGLHCAQIAHELGLHRHTVEKYVRMSLEEFQASQAYQRDRICIYNLDKLAIDKKRAVHI